MKASRFYLVLIMLTLMAIFTVGCEFSVMSVHNSNESGMSGSFRSRTGEVNAPLAAGTGQLVLEVKGLKIGAGSLIIRLEDEAAKEIWSRPLTSADVGQSFQVEGDPAKAARWVLRSEQGRNGSYDLVWRWQ